MDPIYPNQLTCAKAIVDAFNSGTAWVTLQAQMQSGKSGVIQAIADIISHSPGPHLDGSVVIIMGMSDSYLKDQTAARIPKAQMYHNPDLQKFLKDPTNPLVTSWRVSKPLFVVDESHYGAEKEGVLSQFMNLMKGENLRVLSVSATPIAESYVAPENKVFVKLEPGQGYFGIKTMMEKGNLHQSFQILSDIPKFITEIIPKIKGYAIIRICDEKKAEIFKRTFGSLVQIIDYNMKTNTKLDTILATPPQSPTIILIIKKLRAGATISTRYVSIMFDTAKSTADATAQSLLGRACGYGASASCLGGAKNTEIQIYCDEVMAYQYFKWVVSGYSDDALPTKAAHVKPLVVKKNPEGIPKLYKVPEDLWFLVENKGKVDEVSVKTCLEQSGIPGYEGYSINKVKVVVKGSAFDGPYNHALTKKRYTFTGEPKSMNIYLDNRRSSPTRDMMVIAVYPEPIERSDEAMTVGQITQGKKGEMFYEF